MPQAPEKACVTIGNFDGVHAGHKALISDARAVAARDGLKFALITFHPHPREVLLGRGAHTPLVSRAEKLEILRGLGADEIIELPFTPALAARSAEEFVVSRLLPLNLKRLVIGYDFALGRDREGARDALAVLGEKYGFAVSQIPPYEIDGEAVSSTLIRRRVGEGDVEGAARLLGRPYSLRGRVGRGFGRGRLLGFPTANLEGYETLLPARGVYAVFASWDGRRAPAVANIGLNPTFNGQSLTVETFILDTRADLYDQPLSLEFAQKLRDERRFAAPEDLKRQIGLDASLAREILAS